MITERGGVKDVAKLLDFGLVVSRVPAHGEARLTEVGMFVGTPEFMSPEQCAGGEIEVGPASDLYSLGALGYYLLTGRSPFAGRSATQMLAAHLYETPKSLVEHADVPLACRWRSRPCSRSVSRSRRTTALSMRLLSPWPCRRRSAGRRSGRRPSDMP